MQSDRRIFLTEKGEACEAEDPRAAFLLVGEGAQIDDREAARLGIRKGDDGRLLLGEDPDRVLSDLDAGLSVPEMIERLESLGYEVRLRNQPDGNGGWGDLPQFFGPGVDGEVSGVRSDVETTARMGPDKTTAREAPANQCQGTTQAGTQCKRAAAPGSRFCAKHDEAAE